MNSILKLTTILTGVCALFACDQSEPEIQAGEAQSTAISDSRADLETAADEGSVSDFFAAAYERAKTSVQPTTIEEINSKLRPHDRIFRPEGAGPFPAILFFHGCSGPTASHEDEWAEFYTGLGMVMIAVDSYKGRGIDWEDACNAKAMTPWQRAGDVLATLSYARGLDYVDGERMAVTGFSHGAFTIWQTLVMASTKSPPLGLAEWPDDALDGLKAAYPFYGSCGERWDVAVPMINFLGDADRYIDEQVCVTYLKENADLANIFSYRIFDGATHTFDHANPNQANVEAGSVYDAEATGTARTLIRDHLQVVFAP